MTKSTAILLTLCAAITASVPAVLTAQAGRGQPAPPCVAGAGFICGVDGPEDLVAVPGGVWVIVSSYSQKGGLQLIRIADRTTTVGYPSASSSERFDQKTYAACPSVPDEAMKGKFLTHGLSLLPGANGVHKLFVVIHGPRESIEVFEVDARKGTPTFTWIGCTVAPSTVGINSVRGLPDGGVVLTNFNPPGGNMKAMQSGERNGELWEWHPAGTWEKVPGSESSGANGLELSNDGRWIYVGEMGTQSFYRLAKGQSPPARMAVPLGFRVDNLRWASDGTLLAAGAAAGASVVAKVDPQTLSVRELYRQPNPPGFGGASVALEVGKELWIGSFRGDRIVTAPAP